MDDLRKAYRTTKLIGLSMLGSVLMYAALVELIRARIILFDVPAPGPFIATTKTILFVLSAAYFFLIPFIEGSIRSRVHSRSNAGGQSSGTADIQALMTAAVVTFALCESVGVFGLVLFLLGGGSTDVYVFLLISLSFFSFFFPKYGAWEAWVRNKDIVEED